MIAAKNSQFTMSDRERHHYCSQKFEVDNVWPGTSSLLPPEDLSTPFSSETEKLKETKYLVYFEKKFLYQIKK